MHHTGVHQTASVANMKLKTTTKIVKPFKPLKKHGNFFGTLSS